MPTPVFLWNLLNPKRVTTKDLGEFSIEEAGRMSQGSDQFTGIRRLDFGDVFRCTASIYMGLLYKYGAEPIGYMRNPFYATEE